MGREKMLDLLLINPGNRSQAYQALASTLAAIEPPIWAGLLATFVRRRGFTVQILDANAENLTPEATALRVKQLNPVLTAIVVYGHNPSASTQVMPAVGEICTALQTSRLDTKIILVGGHVAALPERTMQEEMADFVCGGEGPYTLVELLDILQSGCADFSKVPDLWYREGDLIKSTSPAPLVLDLDDEMPGIAWDLLPMDKYRAHNWHCFGGLDRQPYAAIYTTLGCPFHCSFCCIQAPFKRGEQALGYKAAVNSYRRWSPEAVIQQIDQLVNEFGVKNIKFADEIFVLNRQHVEGICDFIIERGYDLNIWAYARVDTIKTPGLIEKMKKAGINWLAFGIEAANERVRDGVHKGYDQEEVYRTIAAVRAAGINVIGNYIFGLPEDDLATMQATLDLAMDLNCEFANFYCTMAYPGSRLYDLAVKEGWALPDKWSRYSQLSVDTLPLSTKYLSGIEVLLFRDKAFNIYFNNKNYQNMLINKFGDNSYKSLSEMMANNIDRNL